MLQRTNSLIIRPLYDRAPVARVESRCDIELFLLRSSTYDYNDHDDLYEAWRMTYGLAKLDRG
jgi:hypothetical protein